MKQICTSIEPKLWEKWDLWKDSEALRRASGFPLEFIRNMTGGNDLIDKRFKDFLKEYFYPEGLKRNYLLAVFKRSHCMTVNLSEWMGQIFVSIALFEPGGKESLFELTVIFRDHFSAEYQGMKPPVNFPNG
jgi:hypothetical protein